MPFIYNSVSSLNSKGASLNKAYIDSIVANYNQSLTIFMERGGNSNASGPSLEEVEITSSLGSVVDDAANEDTNLHSTLDFGSNEEYTLERYQHNMAILLKMAEVRSRFYDKLKEYLIERTYSAQDIDVVLNKFHDRIGSLDSVLKDMRKTRSKLILLKLANESLEKIDDIYNRKFLDKIKTLASMIKRRRAPP